jgi:hypothetical protein
MPALALKPGDIAVASVAHVAAILCSIHYLRTTEEKAWQPFWIPILLPFVGTLTAGYKLVHGAIVTAAVVASLVFWYTAQQDEAYMYMLSIFLAVISQ